MPPKIDLILLPGPRFMQTEEPRPLRRPGLEGRPAGRPEIRICIYPTYEQKPESQITASAPYMGSRGFGCGAHGFCHCCRRVDLALLIGRLSPGRVERPGLSNELQSEKEIHRPTFSSHRRRPESLKSAVPVSLLVLFLLVSCTPEDPDTD